MPYSLGLILVLTSWISGAYIIMNWRNPSFNTLSAHAASDKRAYALLAVVLVIGGAFFYAWLLDWLRPLMDYPAAFTILLTITVCLQFLTGLVPDVTGWRRTTHHFVALRMAMLYLLITILIAFFSHASMVAKIASLLGIVWMLTTIVICALDKRRQHFLAYQTSFILTFMSLLLVAVYL